MVKVKVKVKLTPKMITMLKESIPANQWSAVLPDERLAKINRLGCIESPLSELSYFLMFIPRSGHTGYALRRRLKAAIEKAAK